MAAAKKSIWAKLSGGERGGMVVEITNPAADIDGNKEFVVGEGPIVDRYRLVELPDVVGDMHPLIEELDWIPLEGGTPRRVTAQHATYCGKQKA